MSPSDSPYTDWIGRTETVEDPLATTQAAKVAAMLDGYETPGDGDPLPPLWHWFHFLPRAAQSELGTDGHPRKGGFLPPVDLPRRMFAGARVSFHDPAVLGRPASRQGEILNVTEKSGGSGRLVFVTVRYRIVQDARLCIEEEQDIVYREPGAALAAPKVLDAWPAAPEGARTRIVVPDPRLLFRFSALTFNAHRIHYDRPYATSEEGYPGLVVHGPLTALLLLNLARDGDPRRLTGFSFRGRAPLFDLAPFRLLAQPDGGAVTLEAQGPDGGATMTATANFG